MNPVRKVASMNNFKTIDRFWVNVAVRLQILQFREALDWDEIVSDASTLQEIACGRVDGGGFPTSTLS